MKPLPPRTPEQIAADTDAASARQSNGTLRIVHGYTLRQLETARRFGQAEREAELQIVTTRQEAELERRGIDVEAIVGEGLG